MPDASGAIRAPTAANVIFRQVPILMQTTAAGSTETIVNCFSTAGTSLSSVDVSNITQVFCSATGGTYDAGTNTCTPGAGVGPGPSSSGFGFGLVGAAQSLGETTNPTTMTFPGGYIGPIDLATTQDCPPSTTASPFGTAGGASCSPIGGYCKRPGPSGAPGATEVLKCATPAPSFVTPAGGATPEGTM